MPVLCEDHLLVSLFNEDSVRDLDSYNVHSDGVEVELGWKDEKVIDDSGNELFISLPMLFKLLPRCLGVSLREATFRDRLVLEKEVFSAEAGEVRVMLEVVESEHLLLYLNESIVHFVKVLLLVRLFGKESDYERLFFIRSSGDLLPKRGPDDL